MERISAQALDQRLDAAAAGPRYWSSVGVLSLVAAVDYFDFYVVGFLVAVLGRAWGLTFGQSSIILVSAGVGSIIGALVWGVVADRIGRKASLVLGMLICGGCSGGVALVGQGDWVSFAILRLGVGLGLAGATTAGVALLVEHSPSRLRSLVAGLGVAFSTVGVLVASASVAGLLDVIGWRGVAAIGFAPIVLSLLVLAIVPESVRWLLAAGRLETARSVAATVLGAPVPELLKPTRTRPSATFRDLAADQRRFWLTVIVWLSAGIANYGVYLWGPTLISTLYGISVAGAARAFMVVAIAGVAGKIAFSLLPQRLGRRRTGQVGGLGIAVTLLGAALACGGWLGPGPVLLICLGLGAVFFDGIYANITPYSAELFPVALAARGVGLAQAANGLGRIVGPVALALIAGADNLVTPKATAAAAAPALMLLAGCGVVIFAAFTWLGVETQGRPLALAVEPEPQPEFQTPDLEASGPRTSVMDRPASG